MRLLLRHRVIELLLVLTAVILAASPVLSRPASDTSEENISNGGTDSDLVGPEQTVALEEELVNSAPAASKKPAKRSQASSSASIAQTILGVPSSPPESVSLSPQVPDPDKKGSVVQGFLLNILHPKPIVDTIREEDKYGNTGDKFAVIGRGVVAGAEGVSQVLLKVLDFPFEAVKKVSRSATEALNNLGSKLIGL